MEQLPKDIFGKWRHAYEEDENGIAVYRPVDYSFAPSRGREGLEIKQDGTFSRIVPGRGDAPETLNGEWKQKDDNLINIFYEASDRAPQKMEITEIKKDILKVRKI